jgi:hypothetical protein
VHLPCRPTPARPALRRLWRRACHGPAGRAVGSSSCGRNRGNRRLHKIGVVRGDRDRQPAPPQFPGNHRSDRGDRSCLEQVYLGPSGIAGLIISSRHFPRSVLGPGDRPEFQTQREHEDEISDELPNSPATNLPSPSGLGFKGPVSFAAKRLNDLA